MEVVFRSERLLSMVLLTTPAPGRQTGNYATCKQAPIERARADARKSLSGACDARPNGIGERLPLYAEADGFAETVSRFS